MRERHNSKFFIVLPLITILVTIQSLNTVGKEYNHQTSFPYVTGDTFREFCDHVIDTDKTRFNPSSVCTGDTIFVATNYVGWFFEKVSPNIVHPYILVTHNADRGVPGSFINYLDDKFFLAWFGQNAKSNLHNKLFNIPIGLANRHWKHGNIGVVKRVQKKIYRRKHLFYMNFSPGTNKNIRTRVYNLFRNNEYCYYQSKKSFESYLIDIAQSKFVLSPPGNGEDCHRTWEALCMGAIPIVQTSFLDPMFEGLPVVIVDDWSKINEEFLKQKYKEMSTKEYNLERLYAPYWFTKIEEMQNKIRSLE